MIAYDNLTIHEKSFKYQDDIIKVVVQASSLTNQQAAELITLVMKYLKYDQFYIRSFIESVIIKTKEIDKSIKTVLLISPKNSSDIWCNIFPNKKIKRTSCDIISPHRKLVRLGFIKRMHRKNILVSIWTVNDEQDMKKFIKKKADFIITNYPDKAKNLVK